MMATTSVLRIASGSTAQASRVCWAVRSPVGFGQHVNRGGRGHGLFEHRAHGARHRQVLDEHSVRLAQVHHAGDRGADLVGNGYETRVRVFVGNAVHRRLAVVGSGDQVSVGRHLTGQACGTRPGPAPCERSRISVEPNVPAARTTRRARTRVGSPCLRRSGASVWTTCSCQTGAAPQVDELLDLQDRRPCEYLGTVLPGFGQQRHIERDLGVVIAAGRAVATANAGIDADPRCRLERRCRPRSSARP